MPTVNTNDLLVQQSAHLTDLTHSVSSLAAKLNEFIELIVIDSRQPDVAIINNSLTRQPSQQSTAEQLWSELASGGTLLLESDYRLMRQGLGRPGVNMNLEIDADEESGVAIVVGPALENAVALVIDGRVVIPIRRDSTTFVVRVDDLVGSMTRSELANDPTVTVLAFGPRGITGRFVGPVFTLFDGHASPKGLA